MSTPRLVATPARSASRGTDNATARASSVHGQLGGRDGSPGASAAGRGAAAAATATPPPPASALDDFVRRLEEARALGASRAPVDERSGSGGRQKDQKRAPRSAAPERTDAATERLVEEWKSEYRDKARTAALAEAQRLAHEREATAAMLAAQPASLAAELLRACGGVTDGAAGAPARQRARASTPPSPRAGMQHLPWSAAAERQRRAATPPPRV